MLVVMLHSSTSRLFSDDGVTARCREQHLKGGWQAPVMLRVTRDMSPGSGLPGLQFSLKGKGISG